MTKIILSIILILQHLLSMTIIGPAHVSYASPGVLERVAENRSNGITRYHLTKDWKEYEILIGVDDCSLIDKEATLITTSGTYKGLVVDCTASHNKSLKSLNLIADINNKDLTHRVGVILIGFP